ncbi:MAG: hypothetical protein JW838_03750 [Spirochaetes bacterium]|nr:hypothetical protein [Spirochaetota bacterium]
MKQTFTLAGLVVILCVVMGTACQTRQSEPVNISPELSRALDNLGNMVGPVETQKRIVFAPKNGSAQDYRNWVTECHAEAQRRHPGKKIRFIDIDDNSMGFDSSCKTPGNTEGYCLKIEGMIGENFICVPEACPKSVKKHFEKREETVDTSNNYDDDEDY